MSCYQPTVWPWIAHSPENRVSRDSLSRIPSPLGTASSVAYSRWPRIQCSIFTLGNAGQVQLLTRAFTKGGSMSRWRISEHPWAVPVEDGSKVDELKTVIEKLPQDEFSELARRLSEKEWERWDKEIETDSAAGKLDVLVCETFDSIATNPTRVAMLKDGIDDIRFFHANGLRFLQQFP